MMLNHMFIRISGLQGHIIKEDKDKDGKDNEEDTEETENNDIIIAVDSKGNINENVVDEKKNNRYLLYVITNYLQFIMTASLLAWPIIYSIVISIQNSEFRQFSSNIFSIYFFAQYITGYIYFRQEHYTLLCKKQTNIQKLNYGYLVGFCLALLISITYLMLLIFTNSLGIYSHIYNNVNIVGKVLISVLTFITIFFSYNISFINMVVFTVCFYDHSCKITEYSKKLINFVTVVTEELTIGSIIIEYTEIKTEHSKSVTNLNDILSFATTVGVIGAYFITINFNTDYKNISNYIDVAWFIILCIIYIYTISKLKDSVDDIKDTVNSPQFISRYLDRVNLEMYYSTEEDNVKEDTDAKINKIKDISMRNMIKAHENSENLSWIVLDKKLDSSWKNFTVAGFDMDDETLLKKVIAIIVAILMTVQIDANFF